MILKKPYAFFIKIFKPAHILMSFLTIYLIYLSNKILVFFNNYMHSNENVVGQLIKENLIPSAIYIIPSFIIGLSLIFLGIMFNKKKPIAFYLINIFVYLIIITINIYTSSFLVSMEKIIVSIKIVKFVHDLILINMIFQVLSFVLFLVRGLGLNFTKFNFDSDIAKLNISESDKEEIELSVDIDFDSAKRARKRKLRYLKYFYKENKFIINLSLIFFVVIIGIIFAFLFFKGEKKEEGVIYEMDKFNLKVERSMFLNKNFNNQKITDNYFVIVDVSVQTNFKGISLFLKDFSLEVGEAIFYPETKNLDSFVDIGNPYKNDVLIQEYTNYIFVFEIPEKYLKSDLLFVYSDQGVKTKINLNPQDYVSNNVINKASLQENINFNDTLGDISFSVNSFEIKDKFLIIYNYCVSKDDCISSKEYIKPTIDENFDKYILKLNVDYYDKSSLNINSFYSFFSKFGIIEYEIDNVLYRQLSNFEELKSKKINNKNNIYIGVNSNISNASSINLVFNIRDSKYIYILK